MKSVVKRIFRSFGLEVKKAKPYNEVSKKNMHLSLKAAI
jgi:hypothetical protein